MKCPSCGFGNPVEMKFCGQCGEGLQELCASCSFENPPGFLYCGQWECGAETCGEGTENRAQEPRWDFCGREEPGAVGVQFWQPFGDRLSARSEWRRGAAADDPKRAVGQTGHNDRQSGSYHLRHQTGRNTGAELSGPPADCGLRQAGAGK